MAGGTGRLIGGRAARMVAHDRQPHADRLQPEAFQQRACLEEGGVRQEQSAAEPLVRQHRSLDRDGDRRTSEVDRPRRCGSLARGGQVRAQSGRREARSRRGPGAPKRDYGAFPARVLGVHGSRVRSGRSPSAPYAVQRHMAPDRCWFRQRYRLRHRPHVQRHPCGAVQLELVSDRVPVQLASVASGRHQERLRTATDVDEHAGKLPAVVRGHALRRLGRQVELAGASGLDHRRAHGASEGPVASGWSASASRSSSRADHGRIPGGHRRPQSIGRWCRQTACGVGRPRDAGALRECQPRASLVDSSDLHEGQVVPDH